MKACEQARLMVKVSTAGVFFPFQVQTCSGSACIRGGFGRVRPRRCACLPCLPGCCSAWEPPQACTLWSHNLGRVPARKVSMFSKLSLEGGANGSPHCFGTCIHTHLRGRWVSIVPTDFDLWAASAPLRGSGPSASFAAGASPVARRGSRLAEVRRGVLAPTL